ncbi:MAG: hypothetical protein LOD88_09605, partial [Novibacillus thermophilus]
SAHSEKSIEKVKKVGSTFFTKTFARKVSLARLYFSTGSAIRHCGEREPCMPSNMMDGRGCACCKMAHKPNVFQHSIVVAKIDPPF